MIKPPKGFGWFREDFIGIHCLTHEHVRDAPGFDAVFQELRPYFENTLLAAHKAAFDMGVYDEAYHACMEIQLPDAALRGTALEWKGGVIEQAPVKSPFSGSPAIRIKDLSDLFRKR